MDDLIPKSIDLRIATWNIRSISEKRKNYDIKIIFKQLSNLNIDVACLQETRLFSRGIHNDEKYTLFYSGRNNDRRSNGVGIVKKMMICNPSKFQFKIATWNIRSIPESDVEFHFKKICPKLDELQIDLVFLQETKITPEGQLTCKNYTIKWSGNKKDLLEQGVGVAFKKELTDCFEVRFYSERLAHCRLKTFAGIVNFFNIYGFIPQKKDKINIINNFYAELQAKIIEVPTSEQIYLVGDFNAHVGTDYLKHSTCLGKFCVGNINTNGEELLAFCKKHGFCVTNTFFYVKAIDRYTYFGKSTKKKPPRAQSDFRLKGLSEKNGVKRLLRKTRKKNVSPKTQLDYVITKNQDLMYVLETKPLHDLDLSSYSDHRPVVSEIRMPLTININRYTAFENQCKFVLSVLCKYQTADFDPRNHSITWLGKKVNIPFDKISIDDMLSCIGELLSKIKKMSDSSEYSLKHSTEIKAEVMTLLAVVDCYIIDLLIATRDQISKRFFVFRTKKSIDFVLKHRKQQFPYSKLLDLSDIFDTININVLIKFLLKLGFQEKLVYLISHFIGNVRCRMFKNKNEFFTIFDEKVLKFNVESALGDTIASYIFEQLKPIETKETTLVDMFVTYVFDMSFKAIDSHKTSSLFSDRDSQIEVYGFGDSATIIADSQEKLQLYVETIKNTLRDFGLTPDVCVEKEETI